MERLHFTMRLRAGAEAEYERRHLDVWPTLVADLYAAGWRNYSLFRRDRTVHGYAECHPDVATANAAMAASTANVQWATWFEDVIEELTDAHGALFTAQEVWHMDEEPTPGT